MRNRFVGVDFSGARDAGRRIWIAEGTSGARGMVLERCLRARDLPGGARDREAALSALVAYLRASGPAAVVGMDFPFGLPRNLVVEPDWPAFVRGFRDRYPSADGFRASMRSVSGGSEVKRCTDKHAKTPFCPWNLRLYRQSWHGIADVLAPLAASGAARAVPMQPADPAVPLLLETCPASLLKAEALYRPYKGRGTVAREGRERILHALEERGLLQRPAPGVRATLLDNPGGDALDAVLAAICAARAVADPRRLLPTSDADRIEARVYF